MPWVWLFAAPAPTEADTLGEDWGSWDDDQIEEVEQGALVSLPKTGAASLWDGVSVNITCLYITCVYADITLMS